MWPPFSIMRLVMRSLVSLMRFHLSVSMLLLRSHFSILRRPHIPISGLCLPLLLSLIFFIEISFLEMMLGEIASRKWTRRTWFLLMKDINPSSQVIEDMNHYLTGALH